jgi:hypothetical protein
MEWITGVLRSMHRYTYQLCPLRRPRNSDAPTARTYPVPRTGFLMQPYDTRSLGSLGQWLEVYSARNQVLTRKGQGHFKVKQGPTVEQF